MKRAFLVLPVMAALLTSGCAYTGGQLSTRMRSIPLYGPPVSPTFRYMHQDHEDMREGYESHRDRRHEDRHDNRRDNRHDNRGDDDR